ncbi:MAG: GHMP kinase [Bryobacterales bacterium]|nr:GHMP kinase [Bryobacterales bacterium]
MIETRAHARAGILGNPSDGYYGKTIALTLRNFRSRTLLYPSARLEIRPSATDIPIWENLEHLRQQTRWHGYYGGIRILRALLMRFSDYCQQERIELDDRNFTIEYESTIPLRLGLGGSSAIITSALRALMEFFDVEIPRSIQANIVLETETKELGVSAGLQDRVVQVYEGLVYMDFDRELMQSRGYGDYEVMDSAVLPNLYIAYRTSLSEGTEVFHNSLRRRYESGDRRVREAMRQWARMAEEGRAALLAGDTRRFGQLIDDNFDLRAKVTELSPQNRSMVEAARSLGATAKFAGSGGAIMGTYRDEEHFKTLRGGLSRKGIRTIRPVI